MWKRKRSKLDETAMSIDGVTVSETPWLGIGLGLVLGLGLGFGSG